MNRDSAAYEENNKQSRRERDAKRAKKLGGKRGSFSAQIKHSLFQKQGGLCPCCFQEIPRAECGEVDHVTPLERGGRNDSTNLLLVHAQCNREKHKKTLPEHWEWRVTVGLDPENLGRKYGFLP